MEEGPGHNYLVAHSAGSGKSNTIAWTAHRLANLHDTSNVKVFDKVIVITDRIVLDDQLGDTIPVDRVRGVVKRIDASGGSKSANLADALTDATSKIVVCTLQTFGFVTEKLRELGAGMSDKKFAVLVDEAHSSQTGQSAAAAKAARTVEAPDEEAALDLAEAEQSVEEAATPDGQDELNELVAGRGKQDTISYYAFTATPKARTRELFGTLVEVDGEPRYVAAHTYTMRQAIEEGFILDVLENYTTYKTFWKIEKAIRDDPEFDERKAKAAIARFVSLHPTNLAQKTQVIVEHFRQHVAHRIGGHAKAMVVTSSRLHAVRYKEAIDRYIVDKGYQIRALVAFSGTVIDGGDEFTEGGMNRFPMAETARRFDTDDYQVMIVAEKFQTGFDQPLLHTMYVDKTLNGLNAVQTLSRLNRIYPGKKETFVLDFRNDAEDITDAFAPYYDARRSDPDRPEPDVRRPHCRPLLDVIRSDDVDAFATAFVSDAKDTHVKTEAALNPAVGRYMALDRGRAGRLQGGPRHVHPGVLVPSPSGGLHRCGGGHVYIYRALKLKIRDEAGQRHRVRQGRTHPPAHRDDVARHAGIEPVHVQEQFWGGRPLSEAARRRCHRSWTRSTNATALTSKEEERLELVIDQYEGAFRSNDDVVAAAFVANDNMDDFVKVVFDPIFLDTIITQMNASEKIFKLILADDRMRVLLRDYIAQKVSTTSGHRAGWLANTRCVGRL